jgi:hypothetical protein
MQYLPIEDNFGSGSAGAHLDEGPYLESVNRTINGVFYPSFPEEIITPLLDYPNNYISRITLGILQDLGYTINYGSQYLSDDINYNDTRPDAS